MLVARGLQQNVAARREPGHAIRGADAAIVLHAATEEHHVAIVRRDAAEIHDARGRRTAEAHVATGHERSVRHIECARGERGGVDAPVRADEDAVGVDEIDLPVRLQRAVNRRGDAARHAVERRGSGIRLDELCQLSRADGKILPVNDAALRGLADCRHARASADRDRAIRDLPDLGICVEQRNESRNPGHEDRQCRYTT